MTPHRAAVNLYGGTVDVRTRPTRQVHDHTRDVLGPSQPLRRVARGVFLEAARHLQQARRHLRREEPRTDGINQDVPRPELDGQVAAQVDRGGLAGAVRVRALLSQRANTDTRNRRRDDDAAGVVDRRAPLQ